MEKDDYKTTCQCSGCQGKRREKEIEKVELLSARAIISAERCETAVESVTADLRTMRLLRNEIGNAQKELREMMKREASKCEEMLDKALLAFSTKINSSRAKEQVKDPVCELRSSWLTWLYEVLSSDTIYSEWRESPERRERFLSAVFDEITLAKNNALQKRKLSHCGPIESVGAFVPVHFLSWVRSIVGSGPLTATSISEIKKGINQAIGD